ncbi:MAG: hypothetical protein ACKPKO_38525, partial [Candidatus Fonsibacter sp.]
MEALDYIDAVDWFADVWETVADHPPQEQPATESEQQPATESEQQPATESEQQISQQAEEEEEVEAQTDEEATPINNHLLLWFPILNVWCNGQLFWLRTAAHGGFNINLLLPPG